MNDLEINLKETGAKIAALRRERGYTGESLAERLHVSPQAVSKWENAKCLPETSILPALAEALDCSIDSLLYPGELFILEAIYTDGQTHIPVTRFLNHMVRDNKLNIYVNPPFIGAALESDRLKVLTVKFQTPDGVYLSYALQNEPLILDRKSQGFTEDSSFQIIGACYGNEKEHSSVLQKMRHYEYFKWDKITVNHENFPSNTSSDDMEYLTLIYLNSDGIHVISCPENDAIYYTDNCSQLRLRDHSKCILKNIARLSWREGMECPWAGALCTALQYMGEPFSYHQIMGMSGACYRICFTDVWDYSCTDALVAYDYASPLSLASGYSFRMAHRLEKWERKAERLAIMEDIQNGRPVPAINLRVAPEWGVITGYTDNGSRFLCRTYFDEEIFTALEQENEQNQKDRHLIFDENEGYLFTDFWPFLILHFGEKKEALPPLSILAASLRTLIDSFHAGKNRERLEEPKVKQEKFLLPQSNYSLSIIFQCPFLGEPQRMSIPRSFSFLIFTSTFLPDTPTSFASFAAESFASTDKSSKIFLCVSFKSPPDCFCSFSDASPMHCHYYLIFPIVVCDKDSHGTYRQKPESQDSEVHTVQPPVLSFVFRFPMLQ